MKIQSCTALPGQGCQGTPVRLQQPCPKLSHARRFKGPRKRETPALCIPVPPGTLIKKRKTGQLLGELLVPGTALLVSQSACAIGLVGLGRGLDSSCWVSVPCHHLDCRLRHACTWGAPPSAVRDGQLLVREPGGHAVRGPQRLHAAQLRRHPQPCPGCTAPPCA